MKPNLAGLFKSVGIAVSRWFDAPRYALISQRIPYFASVLELGCGSSRLFYGYLKAKNVDYVGLDVEGEALAKLNRSGGTGLFWDLAESTPLPSADYVVLQSQLLGLEEQSAHAVLNRAFQAARKGVVISEKEGPQNGRTSPLSGERFKKMLLPYTSQYVYRQLLKTGGEKLYWFELALKAQPVLAPVKQ